MIIFEEFKTELQAFFSEKPENAVSLRIHLKEAFKISGRTLVKPTLVHGNQVLPVRENMLPDDGYLEIPDTDGTVTDVPGVLLTSTHADCIPVYFYDPVKRVIGLSHSGWKGTLLEIAKETVHVMVREYGVSPSDIHAFVGPGIGLCHFEVRKDVTEPFLLNLPWSEAYIHADGDHIHFHVDLKGIIQKTLSDSGVSHITVSPECTFCKEEKYYSFRRSKDAERMLAGIELLS